MSPMVKRPFNVELALLGLLEEKPRHGYEIDQILRRNEGLGKIWHIRQNHLYALLGKMEKDGYIAAHDEPQNGRPLRQVYTLLPSGQAAFTQWMTSPVNHPRQFRQEFMARLYFAIHQGPGKAQALLEAQRQVCETWIGAIQAEQDALAEGDQFGRVLLSFRKENLDAINTWLMKNLEEIPLRTHPHD